MANGFYYNLTLKPHVRVIRGQRIVHCASSSRGSNKGPPRSGRTLDRPPGCCSCSGQSDERRAWGDPGGPWESLEKALGRPWETQKKKKRSAPGFEPRTFGTRSEGLNRSATEARADQGQERGVGARVGLPGQKMVDCFRHIGIGVCFFRS